jgi:hypothetical protein
MKIELGKWTRTGSRLGVPYPNGVSAVVINLVEGNEGRRAVISCYDTDGEEMDEVAVDPVSFTRAGLFRHSAKLLKSACYVRGIELEGNIDQSVEAKRLYDTWITANNDGLSIPEACRSPVMPEQSKHQHKSHRTPIQAEKTMEVKSITSDATLQMMMGSFEFGGKVVASTATLKVCRKIATKLVRKYLPEEHHAVLETRVGVIMVDLATPAVIHALAQRGILPASEFLGDAAGYAFQGGVIRHGLEITDMMGDAMEEIQGELGELTAMAMEFAKDVGKVVTTEPEEAPMLAEAMPVMAEDFVTAQDTIRTGGRVGNGGAPMSAGSTNGNKYL